MDYSLTDDNARLIDRLNRQFSGIATRAETADVAGELPTENWRDVCDSGYLRVFHPVEIGGLGVDGVTQAMAMESLARACPSTYWSATMSGLVCAKLICTHGNFADHGRLLASLLAGRRLACFAVVEVTSGSDSSTYSTIVRRDGDAYVIDGEKARIANATNADVAIVFARLADHEFGWCYSFVDLHQTGVCTYEMPHLGLRAMPFGSLIFDRVRIEPRDVVPIQPAKFPEGVAWGWLFISIGSIAIAESALTCSVEHARKQVAFGRPLAHMEGVQAALADMRVEIDAARLLAYRCAWHRAEGRLAQDLLAMLKPYATEMAVRVTQRAVEIHGSWGLTPGYAVERLYRDAPMNVIGGSAANRVRELAAQQLGLAPTYQAFDWLAATGLERDSIPYENNSHRGEHAADFAEIGR